MNWGLSVLGLGKHFLLQGASLFWTMLFAFIFLREWPTLFEALCCIGIIAGDTLVAWEVGSNGKSSILPLVVNLLPPLLEGIILVILRWTVVKTMDEKLPQAIRMTSPEVTAFKLFFSALAVLPFAIFFEGFLLGPHKESAVPAFSGLADANAWIYVLIFGGAVLTVIFQVNITAISFIASAITVGVVAEVKIVFQILSVYAIPVKAAKTTPFTDLKTAGTVLVVVSALGYALFKYWKRTRQQHRAHTSEEASVLSRCLFG